MRECGFDIKTKGVDTIELHGNGKTVTMKAEVNGVDASDDNILKLIEKMGFTINSTTIPVGNRWKRAIEVKKSYMTPLI